MPTPKIDVSALVRGLGVNDRDRADRLHELTGCRLSAKTVERIGAGAIPKTAVALVRLLIGSSVNFDGRYDEYSTEPQPTINDNGS